MKDRSKNAARSRREKENAEFSELAGLLPLPVTLTSQLDKASIIRLTTSYLKMRNLFPAGLGKEWGTTAPSEDGLIKELSSYLLQSLDGFVFILDPKGKIIYISETASVHLGLAQVELTGNNIFEYVHTADSEEMQNVLKFHEIFPFHEGMCDGFEVKRDFSIRMKCVLAKRNAGLVAGGYKVIHCSGYLKVKAVLSPVPGCMPSSVEVKGLVAVGHSLPPSAITEVKMTSRVFMFRANYDLSLVYVDERFSILSGHDAASVIGKTLYQYIHASDCLQMRMDHSILIAKGQVVTKYYRLLTSFGGWIWIQSHCTVIQNSRSSRPYSIVSLNHVISKQEYLDFTIDLVQVSEIVTRPNIPTSSLKINKTRQSSSEGKDPSSSSNGFINSASITPEEDSKCAILSPMEDVKPFLPENEKPLLIPFAIENTPMVDHQVAVVEETVLHYSHLTATDHVATPSPSFTNTQRFFPPSPSPPQDHFPITNPSNGLSGYSLPSEIDSRSLQLQSGGTMTCMSHGLHKDSVRVDHELLRRISTGSFEVDTSNDNFQFDRLLCLGDGSSSEGSLCSPGLPQMQPPTYHALTHSGDLNERTFEMASENGHSYESRNVIEYKSYYHMAMTRMLINEDSMKLKRSSEFLEPSPKRPLVEPSITFTDRGHTYDESFLQSSSRFCQSTNEMAEISPKCLPLSDMTYLANSDDVFQHSQLYSVNSLHPPCQDDVKLNHFVDNFNVSPSADDTLSSSQFLLHNNESLNPVLNSSDSGVGLEYEVIKIYGKHVLFPEDFQSKLSLLMNSRDFEGTSPICPSLCERGSLNIDSVGFTNTKQM